MAGQSTSHTDSRITIRFGEQDADLRAWLGQFAATYDMSKVIKLACYLLSGIEPDEGLLALWSTIQDKQVTQAPSAPVEDQQSTSDMVATMMQEVAALRESVAQGEEAINQFVAIIQETAATRAAVEQRDEMSAPAEESIPISDSRRRRQQKRAPITMPLPPDEPYQEPEPVVVSGLNMSRERRRSGPPKVIQVAESVPFVDTEEASRQFLASINTFEQGIRRGR